LNVTADSVTRWAAAGMPVLKRGAGRGKPTTFDLRAALHWWVTTEGAAAARERLWLAQAAKAEFDLAVQKGQYNEVDEAKRDAATVSRAVCMKLRGLPFAYIEQVLTIGARDGRASAATFLLSKIDHALRELAALGDPDEKEVAAS